MTSRAMLLLLAVAVSVTAASTTACKPAPEEEPPPPPLARDAAAEAFAEHICAAIYACECGNAIESEAACVAELTGEFQAQIAERSQTAPIWDEECAGALMAAWSDWGCQGQTAVMSEVEFSLAECPVMKGSQPVGADCNDFPLGDTCEVGLSCVAGVCVQSPVPVPVGQQCGFDWDELPCVAGAYCTYVSDVAVQICEALPQAGDPCDPNADYLCGPSSNDLYCDVSGTCEPAPRAGEPCFDGFLCGPGLYCDGGQDFTCLPKAEIGGGCGGDAVCPTDASCIGNVCEADPALACSLSYFQF